MNGREGEEERAGGMDDVQRRKEAEGDERGEIAKYRNRVRDNREKGEIDRGPSICKRTR